MARKDDDDDLGVAARALADAVTTLSKALGQGLTEASQEVGTQLASSLREVSRELADASVEVGRRAGEQRRRAKADRTRAALLDAARTVFARQGYEGASVGDVASEAGFTKGAVYANFGGKEELLMEIVRELGQDEVAWYAERDGQDLASALHCAHDDPELLVRTLLSLEIFTYAVRHADSRKVLAPIIGTSLTNAARLLHPGDDEPTQDERDTAIGLLAVHTYVSVLEPLLGDELVGVADRLTARLLPPA
ncbi:MAG: TetR/AcrR family transcriptional regulator [Actinobacteria bacterium]|nr:TetR/AcrR family transcriptional regulator [Actinomycetota bacterium]